VDYALEKGCILVAAGGNDGIEQTIYPAGYPDVIGVSALGYNNEIWPLSNTGRHINVTAPGLNIISTGLESNYIYASGTSASASMVSALAAMLISEKPDLSSSFIERLIIQSAKDLGEKGWDKIYGSGEIDAHAALNQKVRPFHDVAVKSISIEPMAFEAGKPTNIVADIENRGTYKSEECDVVLYEIIGEEKKEIGKKQALTVIDKSKVIFDWKPRDLKQIVKFEVAVFSSKDTNISNNTKTTSNYSINEHDGMYVLYAVEPPVHQWIALQAYLKLNSLSGNEDLVAEMEDYLPTDPDDYHYSSDFTYSDNWSSNDNAPYDSLTALIEGACEEDKGENFPILEIPLRSLNHFWNPNGGFDDGLDLTSYGINTQSALQKAKVMFDIAINAYNGDNGDERLAYYWLGRTAHLLMDMSVPAHTLLDPHGGLLGGDDNYEEYTGDHYSEITSDDAQIPIALKDYGTDGYGCPEDFKLGLTNLMYTLAEVSNDFDSDNRNGKGETYGNGMFRNARNILDAGKVVDRVEYWDSTILGNPDNIIRPMYQYYDYYIIQTSCEYRIYYYESFYNTINYTDNGVRVYYTDGSDSYFYNLDENNIDEIWDEPLECIYQPELQARAIGYVAALYQLFWNETHPVHFNDANLKTLIEEKLGIVNPTQSDMLGLTQLSGGSSGIIDLTGLEYATNLTQLYLYNNQISNISALSGLTNLLWLDLYNNQISDISALSGLTNLYELDLDNNQISDISALTGLTNLTGLLLDNNPLDCDAILKKIPIFIERGVYVEWSDDGDTDRDDDGILNIDEDKNQNGAVDPGETDPCNADTDGDGIQDGTELGITVPVADPDGDGPLLGTDTSIFIPDADPTTTTDPLNSDTDGDGLSDGQEDTNHNGMFDPGELDPNHVQGDVDGDGDVDSEDSILALQVMAGITPSTTIYKEADVNGDGKIGMGEVLFILQWVAGLRF
jgi:subtilase family protein/Leucine Rich Repeat (LRR) protein/dockerin type I repeat protein